MLESFKTKLLRIGLLIVTPFVFFSCASTSRDADSLSLYYPSSPSKDFLKQQKDFFADGTPVVDSKTAFQDYDSLLVTFAGDLMAHKPNWDRGHYDEIYEDIKDKLLDCPLVFANLETPVCDSRPYSTFPNFNVHHEYVEAAIDAGFNVFSLTNNHTNDQFLEGINSTREWFLEKEAETKETQRPVYAAGLKTKPEDPLTYRIIKQDDWTILFVSITEILNSNSYSGYIDYIPPTKAKRQAFIQEIKKLHDDNPHDIFVLSIHCCDPEYIFKVTDSQRNYYLELLDAGVDILWGNHPHVSKIWELVPDEDNVPRKLIFYSMGNSISAQRTNPSFSAPDTNRDYTGEGYMTQVRFVRENGSVRIALIDPVILTTYINTYNRYQIKVLNDEFISSLKTSHPVWSKYLQERKNLMEKISGTVIWH
ncbi:MAG: CapA family protein [Treponema sp.]|nr:CapA family protein [Treponema sp.]